jgi:hypothetical protein
LSLANPARVFNRPKPLIAKPYERRTVCVLPAHQYSVMHCGTHTHFSRTKVQDAIDRGEMVYLDPAGKPTGRRTNTAGFTDKAAGSWQKTQSGPVCTMQMIVGEKGRHIPAQQRDNWQAEL